MIKTFDNCVISKADVWAISPPSSYNPVPALIILNIIVLFPGDVIPKLKGTSTLSDMVQQIKRLYRVSGLGAFSLQYCEVFWDSVFYKDEQEIDPNSKENETLENFFGNEEGAEIIYVPKTAGCDDIMIGNATDDDLVAKLEYGIINRQPLT